MNTCSGTETYPYPVHSFMIHYVTENRGEITILVSELHEFF